MTIGICDDNPQLCKILTQTLLSGNYVQEDLEITEFHSAAELLDSPKIQELDLLFLDIEMPEMTGMDLLRQYGQIFGNTKVAFLTSHPEYLSEGYEVNIYRYLRKPIEKEKLSELFRSIEASEVLNQTICVRCSGTDVTLRLKDIIYIEAFNNYIDIITPAKTLSSYMRLKDLLPRLPEDYFYQTHKSYIVNMKFIRKYEKTSGIIWLTNGSRIYTAIRKRLIFDQIYTHFLLHFYS